MMRAILLSLTIMLVAATAWAQPAETQPAQTQPSASDAGSSAQIKAWFGELADSDGAVRDAAMVKLMGLTRQQLPALRSTVEQSLPLVPSQAAVLREIVTQIYLAGEPYDGRPQAGFLGIHMSEVSVSFTNPADNAAAVRTVPGVVVETRMPGFCAARMLRDGDVILSIVERPNVALRDYNDFATAVRDIPSGQMVHFELLRHGQIKRVGIVLDARPVEADPGLGVADLLEQRRLKAEDFWQRTFAPLVKEGVS